MTYSSRTSLYATAAISAALAFGSTPAFAQAGETIVLPPVAEAPPAASAPTIVLPPSVSEPAAPAAEAPAPRAEAARPERAAPRASAPKAAAPRAEAAATAPPADPVAEVAPFVVPVAAQPAAPVAEAPQRDSVRRPVDVPGEIIAASVLGVLGLGLAGFVATRRRRPEDLVDDAYEPEPEFVAPEFVGDAPITSIPDELAVRAEAVPAAQASPLVRDPAIGDGSVPTGDARQQLLAAMVAAPPDAENPFTSAKARRRRARILLAGREQARGDGEAFDWRTYRSTAPRRPASSPLIDA